MSFDFKWDKKKWNNFVKKIEKNLSKEKIDRVLELTAYKGISIVKQELRPYKKTGAILRSWYVKKKKRGEYSIFSNSKISLYLNEGTGIHGPKNRYIRPKTKKFLYIPLRPGAAVWRKSFVFGKDYVLAKKVKGIRPLNYLVPVTKSTQRVMVARFKEHLAKAGSGA